MTRKIRTTLIALVAAFSFAATTVPTVQAQPNDGRYGQSAEGTKRSACNAAQARLNKLSAGAARDFANGDVDGWKKASTLYNRVQNWMNQNCRYA